MNALARLPSLAAIEAELDRRRSMRFACLFPDAGSLARRFYPKQLAFFRAGATYPERLFLKANRVGGTLAAAYEVTAHLTGEYPTWWEGFRFTRPIQAWAAGKSTETTRNVIQLELLGPRRTEGASRDEYGTGMIPSHRLLEWTHRSGVPDAVETIRIRHVSGGISELGLKSYDQGASSYMGTSKDLIWLDEEDPIDMDPIYTECLMRTMTTGGILITTFTPLFGLTAFVESWLDHADCYDGVEVTAAREAIFGEGHASEIEGAA